MMKGKGGPQGNGGAAGGDAPAEAEEEGTYHNFFNSLSNLINSQRRKTKGSRKS